MRAFLEDYRGRIVAFILTPILTAGSAALSVWAAKHLPGVKLDADEIGKIGIAGAVAVLTSSGVWLRNSGRQEEIALVAQHNAEARAAQGDPTPPLGFDKT